VSGVARMEGRRRRENGANADSERGEAEFWMEEERDSEHKDRAQEVDGEGNLGEYLNW
jgi:hypothetical protein